MPNKSIQGRIIKGVGGFYYIKPSGSDEIFECRARGRFRREGLTPLVGDIVNCEIDGASGSGMIVGIMPRINSLIRPPVANVTKIAVVFSVKNPKPNLYTVDKLITAAMYAKIKPIICINKTDLCDCEELYRIYSEAGFDTLCLSAATGENTDTLKKMLEGELTVFAGNSGVGKSSLLNCILKNAELETGEVSGRVERGRHTTRHSELMPLDDMSGYIIDTPGFSSFSVSDMDEKALCGLFPEFAPYIDGCAFGDCSHTVEKGCLVLQALNDGKISKTRHDSYIAQYKELLDNKSY